MIINGTAFALPLKDECVHTIITSPPYWGLRKYSGLPPLIFGGGPKCEHDFNLELRSGMSGGPSKKQESNKGSWFRTTTQGFCACGAWLGDFGLEPTIELYIEHSMQVLAECKRVLRKDGTCWWNLGSSYASNGGQDETFTLKEDLSAEDVAYVLSELAKCDKVVKPMTSVGIDEGITPFAGGE